MDTFALSTDALPRVALLLLTGVLGLAFALRPNKTQGSWWFVGMIVGFVVHHLAQVGLFTVYADWRGSVLIPLTWSSVLIANWASLGFSYRFLGNPFPRESRVVLTASALAMFGAALYVHLTSGRGFGYDPATGVDQFSAALLLLHIAGSVVVLVRRARHPETPDTTRRALRGFGGIIALALVFPVLIFLQESGLLSEWLYEQLSLVSWAVIIMGIVTVHVNYTPEPTSFLAKVVGFAFVAVVTALGVASAFAFRQPTFAPGPPPDALVFAPDGAGGYAISPSGDGPLDLPGETVRVRDGEPLRISLGFAFPFAGTTWREALLDDDGFLSFGPDSIGAFRDIYEGTPIPWIAPLLIGMSPEDGHVTAARDSASLTVTWREVPLTFSTATATAQVTLRADGSIAFRYGRVPLGTVWVRGLAAGVGDHADYQPLREGGGIAPGGAAVENRWALRREANERRALPFAWLMFGAGAFVLLAFPLYLREGLTRPLRRLLDGVRRAASGHLDAEVPVGARDEIGVLTEDFNRMTGSLRQAETALRDYADELETRVDERTAALAESLSDLKSAQARLVQQEKMASLGALTAGIAHEIKNPLNFVNNFAALSRELVAELDEEDDPDEREAILVDLAANAAKIEEHGRRADRIVRDMMDHARTGGGTRSVEDVNALVKEYATLAHLGARARHPHNTASLVLDLAPDAGTAEMVSQEIGRVIINLVDNALDALRQPDSNGDGLAVTVSTHRGERWVEIRVSDPGPGISPEVVSKVFEPFFTTKPTGEGTGLGLSMSYDIVTQGHGGTLEIESAPGEGATFIVRLPA